MMRIKPFLLFAILALLATACLSALPAESHAEPNNPKQLYLLQDTKIYASRNMKAKPTGALKAHQFVNVIQTYAKSQGPEPVEWFQVKTTFQGKRWIKADGYRQVDAHTVVRDFTLLPGTYTKEKRTVTSVEEVALYDALNGNSTGKRMPAQKLQVLASFEQDPVNWDDVMGFFSSQTHWYQIETPDGPGWIRNPRLLEDVIPTKVSYRMLLTGTETAYPNAVPSEDADAETLDPQAVQVLGEWTYGYMSWGEYWYEIQLPQGIRWISPRNPVIKNFQELKKTITLQTETRYFEVPSAPGIYEYSSNWLKPGDYEAFGATGDYIGIHTEQGDVWVNLKRALIERPLGIVAINEQIQLTKQSRYFRFPNTPDVSLPKGFYAPQAVQAYEKYTDAQGNVFYHFGTKSNNNWVLL
jgi:hypothetical protein